MAEPPGDAEGGGLAPAECGGRGGCAAKVLDGGPWGFLLPSPVGGGGGGL